MCKRLRPPGGRPKKLAAAWLFSRTAGWRRAEWQCGYCKEKSLYKRRNCSKYFPALVQIDRKPCWTPKASADKREKAIPGYQLAECPVSYISADSMWILDQLDDNAIARQATGATLFGPDTRRYPAWWLDAIAVVEGVKNLYERTELELLSKNAGN